jgi:PAS domain S-box-containing protein
MSEVTENWSYLSSLRERALTRLTMGARANLSRGDASEAIAVLFKLASSESTASDALALLHEIQVHQVEVEMQQEELSRALVAVESDLIRQTSLIAQAPGAFLVVDKATVVHEINHAGLRILGAKSDVMLGQPFSGLLAEVGSAKLQVMLRRAEDGAGPETSELPLLTKDGNTRSVLCSAAREASSGRFLLVLLAPPSPG